MVRELLVLLLVPLGAASAQNVPVTVHLASGNSVAVRNWYFEYVCLTAVSGNPGLATRRTERLRSLRLRVDSTARVVSEQSILALRFDWTTAPSGTLTRSQARVVLAGGTVIKGWQSYTPGCGEVNLTLPPSGARRGWTRIDLWSTTSYAVPAPDSERVTEIRFGSPQRAPIR
jgi:hypothetical protein